MSTFTPYRSHRRYIILLILVFLLFGGWSVFWYFSAGQAREAIEGWRVREAKAGRIYDCASQSIAGFPFRIEVECDKPSALFHGQQPLAIETRRVLAVAQIYDPTLLIGEISGPLTVADAGSAPSFVFNWSLGQSSIRGTPHAPERVSLVFDNPVLDRVNGNSQSSLLSAKKIEIHGRIAERTAADKPVIEAVLRLRKISAPSLHPATVQPMDIDIAAALRGLKDFAPKSWPSRFREIQAAGGKIDITDARIEQGDILAIGRGALSLNGKGHLEGQLRVSIAGLDQFLEKIGARQAVRNSSAVDRLAGALDRLAPGLGQVARQQAGENISAGINLLGEQTNLEGRRAVSLPLRFDDGAVFLGPIPIGKTAALF